MRFAARVALLLLVPGWMGPPAIAQEQDERTLAVKAAVTLNLARFVTWPTESLGTEEEPLQLCVWQDDPLRDSLDSIEGHEIGGRPFELRALEPEELPSRCHILIVAPARLLDLLDSDEPPMDQPGVLTITDLTGNGRPDDLHGYCVISLVRQGARIGFEINQKAARRANLRLSSELLKLGSLVEDPE